MSGAASDTADERALGGRERRIDASIPVVLGGAVRTLLVLEGAVDVFLRRCEGGVQLGPRVPLGRWHPGDVLIAPPGAGGEGVELLAVGVDGTRVAENPDLRRCAHARQAELVQGLVAALTAVLPAPEPAAPLRRVEAPGYLDGFDGTYYAGGSDEPLWLEAEAPLSFSISGGVPAPAGAPVPVTRRLHALAQGEGGCFARSAHELEDPFAALEVFLSGYERLAAACLAAAEAQESARLERHRHRERDALASAVRELASVVTPQVGPALRDDRDRLLGALEEVGHACGIAILAPPRSEQGLAGGDDLEAIVAASGARMRRVLLRSDWWRRDAGPLLAFLNGSPVALLPRGAGYELSDPATGGRQKVDAACALALEPTAVMLYAPLPERLEGPSDILRALVPLVAPELRGYVALGLLAGGLGAVTPWLMGVLLEHVVPRAALSQLLQLLLGLLAAGLAIVAFEVTRAAMLLRASGRVDLRLQAALFDRLLRLPVRFFRGHEAGELAERLLAIRRIRERLTSSAVSGLLGVLFGVWSFGLLCWYDLLLASVALLLVAAQLLLVVLLVFLQLRAERTAVAGEGRLDGLTVQLLAGIGTLRVAASEAQGFAHWAGLFADAQRRRFAVERIAALRTVFFAGFPALALAVVNLGVVRLGDADDEVFGLGVFIAFTAAFGQLQAAVRAFGDALGDLLAVVPLFERLRPILAATPERREGAAARVLAGGIELERVRFRYEPDGPWVVEDLSLQIAPGEYVAFVGASGSGKSTVLRLLLGFENPEHGVLCFDGVPAQELDPATLRRQIGVVLQHGQLTSGSILSNIVGTSTFTLADAERAAAEVGLDADIARLPMGMHTVITEGVNTLSGGQRQRLLLARALVRRPRLLLLDEATSALDNRTQQIVTDTLARLDCTRVVVAHRLSTITGADRIVVLDRGRIVQQGTYEELLAVSGPFRDLAERQLL